MADSVDPSGRPTRSVTPTIGILELIEDPSAGERPHVTDGVRADQVVRRFGSRIVLDHLDLAVAPGEVVVLLGPPRSGKTTLLRLLAGLDRPDGGSVEVPARRAVVFEADRLLPWQRGLRNVPSGLRGPDADGRVRAVVREVGPAHTLVTEPELVLLDEPFTGLDTATRLRMHDLVRELSRAYHAAILHVTHDIDEAIALADRIDVLRDGRIGSSRVVTLSAADRAASAARTELRSALLAELGFLAEQ